MTFRPDGEEVTAVLARGAEEGTRWIAGLTLVGRFRKTTPLPLAVVAALLPDGSARPVVQFHLAFASRILFFFTDTNWESEDRAHAVFTESGERTLTVLEAPPPDGTTRGHLELASSRDVALESKELDRYFGRDASMPVDIEIVTVDARWADQPGPR
ncbi:MAG: hypothetical protein LAO51_08055 [Acidobacteriia bacterium]|nr:hypothetical protein [Terriglobia bacterium]